MCSIDIQKTPIVGIGGGLVYDQKECIFIHVNKFEETTVFHKRSLSKIVSSVKYNKNSKKESTKKVKGFVISLLDKDHKTLLQVDFDKKDDWKKACSNLLNSDLCLFDRLENLSYYPIEEMGEINSSYINHTNWTGRVPQQNF